MRKPKLIFDFVRYPVQEKIPFFRKVIKNMTHSTLFPTPDVPLTTASEAVDKFETDYLAALDGGKIATAVMHESEEVATEIFRKLAYYVERTANGDETVILSSGFNLSKEPTPAKREELSVTQNHIPGTVFLKRKAVEGAKSYLWQLCQGDSPAGEEGWTFAGATAQTKHEIANLTTAGKYWFRSAAVTKDGTTAYCTPVFKVVQ